MAAAIRLIIERFLARFALFYSARLAPIFSRLFGPRIGALIAAAIGASFKDYFEQIFEWVKDTMELGVKNAIVAHANESLQLELDENNPFSVASFSAAIGKRVGVPIRDVTNKDLLIEDVGAFLAGQINQRAGTNFTKLWPPDELIPQMRAQATAQIMAAVEGRATAFFDASSVSSIVQSVSQKLGAKAAPRSTSKKAILNRVYQKRFYDRMRGAGYKRGYWRKPGAPTGTVTPP
jgi:hypothetical protein